MIYALDSLRHVLTRTDSIVSFLCVIFKVFVRIWGLRYRVDLVSFMTVCQLVYLY